MRTTLLALTMLLFGCASRNQINRDIANNDFFTATAGKRLRIMSKQINLSKKSLSSKGNPRYYLFENFDYRSRKILRNILRTKHQSLNKKVFIPRNKKIGYKLLRVLSAYKAMEKAAIYLNFNPFMPEDSPKAFKNLEDLGRIMNAYHEDLLKSPIKIEARELALEREKIMILRYLVKRMRSQLDHFRISKKSMLSFKRLFKKTFSIKMRSLNTIKSQVKNIYQSKDFKYSRRTFSRLKLPDSSSIDGSEDSFEIVMSLEYGMELYQHIIKQIIK